MAFFLESTRKPGLRYRVAKLDKATMRATLVGELNVPFERVLDAASLEKYGYKIVKVPDEAVAKA
jgi:hypothetical protein